MSSQNNLNRETLIQINDWNEALIYTLIRTGFRLICFTEFTNITDQFLYVKAIVRKHGIFEHLFAQADEQYSYERKLEQITKIIEIIKKKTSFQIKTTKIDDKYEIPISIQSIVKGKIVNYNLKEFQNTYQCKTVAREMIFQFDKWHWKQIEEMKYDNGKKDKHIYYYTLMFKISKSGMFLRKVDYPKKKLCYEEQYEKRYKLVKPKDMKPKLMINGENVFGVFYSIVNKCVITENDLIELQTKERDIIRRKSFDNFNYHLNQIQNNEKQNTHCVKESYDLKKETKTEFQQMIDLTNLKSKNDFIGYQQQFIHPMYTTPNPLMNPNNQPIQKLYTDYPQQKMEQLSNGFYNQINQIYSNENMSESQHEINRTTDLLNVSIIIFLLHQNYKIEFMKKNIIFSDFLHICKITSPTDEILFDRTLFCKKPFDTVTKEEKIIWKNNQICEMMNIVFSKFDIRFLSLDSKQRKVVDSMIDDKKHSLEPRTFIFHFYHPKELLERIEKEQEKLKKGKHNLNYSDTISISGFDMKPDKIIHGTILEKFINSPNTKKINKKKKDIPKGNKSNKNQTKGMEEDSLKQTQNKKTIISQSTNTNTNTISQTTNTSNQHIESKQQQTMKEIKLLEIDLPKYQFKPHINLLNTNNTNQSIRKVSMESLNLNPNKQNNFSNSIHLKQPKQHQNVHMKEKEIAIVNQKEEEKINEKHFEIPQDKIEEFYRELNLALISELNKLLFTIQIIRPKSLEEKEFLYISKIYTNDLEKEHILFKQNKYNINDILSLSSKKQQQMKNNQIMTLINLIEIDNKIKFEMHVVELEKNQFEYLPKNVKIDTKTIDIFDWIFWSSGNEIELQIKQYFMYHQEKIFDLVSSVQNKSEFTKQIIEKSDVYLTMIKEKEKQMEIIQKEDDEIMKYYSQFDNIDEDENISENEMECEKSFDEIVEDMNTIMINYLLTNEYTLILVKRGIPINNCEFTFIKTIIKNDQRIFDLSQYTEYLKSKPFEKQIMKMREKQCKVLANILKEELGIIVEFEGKSSSFKLKTILYPTNLNSDYSTFIRYYKQIDSTKIKLFETSQETNKDMEIEENECTSLIEMMNNENELIIIDGYNDLKDWKQSEQSKEDMTTERKSDKTEINNHDDKIKTKQKESETLPSIDPNNIQDQSHKNQSVLDILKQFPIKTKETQQQTKTSQTQSQIDVPDLQKRFDNSPMETIEPSKQRKEKTSSKTNINNDMINDSSLTIDNILKEKPKKRNKVEIESQSQQHNENNQTNQNELPSPLLIKINNAFIIMLNNVGYSIEIIKPSKDIDDFPFEIISIKKSKNVSLIYDIEEAKTDFYNKIKKENPSKTFEELYEIITQNQYVFLIINQLTILAHLIEKEFDVQFKRCDDTNNNKVISFAEKATVSGHQMTIEKFIDKYTDQSIIASTQSTVRNLLSEKTLVLPSKFKLINNSIYRRKQTFNEYINDSMNEKENQQNEVKVSAPQNTIENEREIDEILIVEWNNILMSLLEIKKYKFNFLTVYSNNSLNEFYFIESIIQPQGNPITIHINKTSLFDMKNYQIKSLMNIVEFEYNVSFTTFYRNDEKNQLLIPQKMIQKLPNNKIIIFNKNRVIEEWKLTTLSEQMKKSQEMVETRIKVWKKQHIDYFIDENNNLNQSFILLLTQALIVFIKNQNGIVEFDNKLQTLYKSINKPNKQSKKEHCPQEFPFVESISKNNKVHKSNLSKIFEQMKYANMMSKTNYVDEKTLMKQLQFQQIIMLSSFAYSLNQLRIIKLFYEVDRNKIIEIPFAVNLNGIISSMSWFIECTLHPEKYPHNNQQFGNNYNDLHKQNSDQINFQIDKPVETKQVEMKQNETKMEEEIKEIKEIKEQKPIETVNETNINNSNNSSNQIQQPSTNYQQTIALNFYLIGYLFEHSYHFEMTLPKVTPTQYFINVHKIFKKNKGIFFDDSKIQYQKPTDNQLSNEHNIYIHRKEQLKALSQLFENEEKIKIIFNFNEKEILIEKIIDCKTNQPIQWNDLLDIFNKFKRLEREIMKAINNRNKRNQQK